MLQTVNHQIKNFKNVLGKFSPRQNLLYGFIAYIILGSLLLSLPIFHKQSASILDHIFTSTSAASTTGLITISVFDTYTFWGQFIIMLLFQVGGIGYLTFTTFVILSTTNNITNWHKKIISTEFSVPKNIRIKDFLKSVIAFTLTMEGVGALFLYFAFKNNGMATLEAIWSAIFHSISAFCTAGFSLYNNSFADFSSNGFVNIIISILSIAGALGFIVITDLGLRIKHRDHKLSFTSRIILIGFALLLTVGTTFIYFFEPVVANLTGSTRFLAAFFQSMTAMTTVGFNTVNVGSFSSAIILVCIFLMYVGASPSGTAGGIKITTLFTAFAVLRSRLKGQKTVTFFNNKIPEKRISIATSAFIFYTTLIALGTFAITLTNDFNFKSIFFEVASALGTVGLTMGITQDLNTFGKLIIILLMFIGRLGVVTFGLAVWAKSKAEDNQDESEKKNKDKDKKGEDEDLNQNEEEGDNNMEDDADDEVDDEDDIAVE